MSAPLRKRRPASVSLPVATVEDARLTRRARGLLAELLAKPEGWDVRSEALARSGPEGRDAILTALNELGRFGYYTIGWRQATRADVAAGTAKRAGTWITETWISDLPVDEWVAEWPTILAEKRRRGTRRDRRPATGSGFPDVGQPDVGRPGAGSPDVGVPDALSSSSLRDELTGEGTQRTTPQPPAERGADCSTDKRPHPNCRGCGTNRRAARPAPPGTPQPPPARDVWAELERRVSAS
jgi:hypothetical protein